MNINSIRQQLASVPSQGGTPKEHQDKYRQALGTIVEIDDHDLRVEGIKAYVEAIVNESVSLHISRQLLAEAIAAISQQPPDISKDLCHSTLERVQPRVVSFEEQICTIRQHLSSLYETEQMWREAAQVLVSSSRQFLFALLISPFQVGIPLETGQKSYTVDYKLRTYLKIARLYLEDDDPIQAEASINRATLLQTETQDEELQILYKFCYARVLGMSSYIFLMKKSI